MGKKCTQKLKFKSLATAQKHANKYMRDVALTFYPMEAFHCDKHNCYHIGHNKYEKAVDKTLEPNVNLKQFEDRGVDVL